MKKMKKIVSGCAIVLALATTPFTAFAASSYKTPAEAVAGLTGLTLEETEARRLSGTHYGTIADEYGKLDEFHQAVSDINKASLDARVSNGTLTQAQANASLAAMNQRHDYCDGSGSDHLGSGTYHVNGHDGNHGHGSGHRRGSHTYR